MKKYDFKLDEALEDFCKKLLRKEFSNADSGFKVKAPEQIYTTWYRTNDAEIIHLLNATGGNAKLGQVMKGTTPEVPFPAIQEDIEISIPATQVKTSYAASPDFAGRKELKYQLKDKTLSITLPKELLKAYTLIWIKK